MRPFRIISETSRGLVAKANEILDISDGAVDVDSVSIVYVGDKYQMAFIKDGNGNGRNQRMPSGWRLANVFEEDIGKNQGDILGNRLVPYQNGAAFFIFVSTAGCEPF